MARSFNGSTDWLRYGGNVGLGGASAWTVAGWARLSTTASSDGRGLFCNWAIGPSTPDGEFIIRARNASDDFYVAIRTSTFVQYGGDTGKKFSDTNWHHWAAVWDGSTLYGYLDGAVGASSFATSGTFGTSTSPTYIGNDGRTDTSALAWEGDMAEVATWRTALSAAQIASLAAGAHPLDVGSPNNFWPLTGNTSPEPDWRSGIDMAVTGAAKADHPRIAYPSLGDVYHVTAAAPSGHPALRRFGGIPYAASHYPHPGVQTW